MTKFFSVIILIVTAMSLGGIQLAAQSTTDEGLPPGWESWASDCGKIGKRDACYNEATRLYWGAGGKPVNKPKAAHFMIMACKYKDADSCRKAVKISRDEIFDVPLYGEVLDTGCLIGEIVFCHEAYQFYSGYGNFETFSKAVQSRVFNPNLALAYANAACKKDSVFACNQIGRAFSPDPEQTLRGIQADKAKSLEGYIQACRLKSLTGCYLAFHGSDGEDGDNPVPKIRTEALSLGCKLNIVGMCETEIATYFNGDKGTSKNRLKAIALMEEGCKRLRDEMCQSAGQAYLEADSPSDYEIEKGLKHMEKACTFAFKDDKKDRCGQAAYYLSMHLGEINARTEHVAYFGCQSGSAASCIIKANSLRANNKIEVSIRDAYQKACDLGHSDGCKWADEINEEFKKAGKKGALEHYQKACDLGHTPTCEWLEGRRQRIADAAQAKKDKEAVAKLRRNVGLYHHLVLGLRVSGELGRNT